MMTDRDHYCIISGQIPVFTLLPVTLQTFFGLLHSPEHCVEASCHVPSGAYLFLCGPLLTKLSRNCHIYGEMRVLLLRCPSVGTFKDVNHEPVTKNNLWPRCNSISLIRKSRFWITGAVATVCRLDIRAKWQAERLWLCAEHRILELV